MHQSNIVSAIWKVYNAFLTNLMVWIETKKLLPALKSIFAKFLITLIVLLKKSFYLPHKNCYIKKIATLKKNIKLNFVTINTSSIVRFRECYKEVDESNICKRLSMAEIKVLSQRNKPKFVHDGCTYIFDKLSGDKLRKFWRCDYRWEGCKARIHPDVSTDQVSSFSKILIIANFTKNYEDHTRACF